MVFSSRRAVTKQHQAFAHLVQRHAVVQVLQGQFDDRIRRNGIPQARAGILDQRRDALEVQRTQLAILAGDIDHMGRLLDPGLGTRTRPLFPIQHVGARDIVFAGAHQSQLDLILDILDMHRPAMRLAAHQCSNNPAGQLLDQFTDPRRCGALAAVHRDERLGQRDRYLGRLKHDHRAIAADHLVLVVRIGNGGRW
jgi:hypothetical protein